MCRREVEFAVGYLPQQEVADAHFAAGSYQQVGVGDAGGGECGRYGLFGYLFGLQCAVFHLLCQLLHGVGQFPARRITQCQHERQAGVDGRFVDTLLQSCGHMGWHAFEVADGQQSNVVLVKCGCFLHNIFDQQFHQGIDFGLRAVPIFGRKCVERQVFDADFGGGFGDFAYRNDAVLVSDQAVAAAFFCPTSVAVHDDGDVLRQVVAVDVRFIGFCVHRFDFIFVIFRHGAHISRKSHERYSPKVENQSRLLNSPAFRW